MEGAFSSARHLTRSRTLSYVRRMCLPLPLPLSLPVKPLVFPYGCQWPCNLHKAVGQKLLPYYLGHNQPWQPRQLQCRHLQRSPTQWAVQILLGNVPMFNVLIFFKIFLWLMPGLPVGVCPIGCTVAPIPRLVRSFGLSFLLKIVGIGLVLWCKGSGLLQLDLPMVFKQSSCVAIKRMTLGSAQHASDRKSACWNLAFLLGAIIYGVVRWRKLLTPLSGVTRGPVASDQLCKAP